MTSYVNEYPVQLSNQSSQRWFPKVTIPINRINGLALASLSTSFACALVNIGATHSYIAREREYAYIFGYVSSCFFVISTTLFLYGKYR